MSKPKMVAPKQLTSNGIKVMLSGAVMVALAMFIAGTQERELESGLLIGLLNGLFFSGILFILIGLIAFVYGRVINKKIGQAFIISIVALSIIFFVAVKVIRYPFAGRNSVQTKDRLETGMQQMIVASLNDQKDMHIKNLTVAVDANRAVTIGGVVPDVNTRERAEKHVAWIPGVTKVFNNLQIESGTKRSLKEAAPLANE